MQSCVCCGHDHFQTFLNFGIVPRTGIYLSDADSLEVPQVPLNLEFCCSCGFIRQVSLLTPRIDYSKVERGTAQQLPHYTEQLVDSLQNLGMSDQSLIFEVGCNDGSFLKVLKSAGFKKLVGIEPSVVLSDSAKASGFQVEQIPLTQDSAKGIATKYGLADAIVCRHTLEHVPDPEDLMKAIAALLKPGGICVIEVPDTDWVIKHLCVHEVWDEHVSYFRPTTLNKLLERCGLTSVQYDTVRFRDTQNLVFIATTNEKQLAIKDIADSTTLADIESCAERWADLVKKLHDTIEKSPKPIVAIGASHIQINFINFSRLENKVQWLIDDDPKKYGHRAPIGKGIFIISTEDAITHLSQGTLLRTAFPYPAWMDKISNALSAKGVSVIDPFRLE